MKSDYNPTVRSLIQQKAIRFIGDQERLKHFSKEYFWVFEGFKHIPYLCDTFVMESYENKKYDADDYIDLPLTTKLLYTLELQADLFTITAHIHSPEGVTHLRIYYKKNPNLDYLKPTYHAIYRHLDNSNAFFICQQCHQLVATSERDTDGKPVCINGQCQSTHKQDFDVTLVDRISCDGNVSVHKDEEDIKFYVSSTYWSSPHEGFRYPRIIKTLPLTATLDEVRRLRDKLEKKHPYPAPCYHCGKLIDEEQGDDLSHFVDFKTDSKICHGCMTWHYGVVF